MAWPSTISSFSNPIPSDRLNSPSHSSIETAQNTGLTELQTYIGVNAGVSSSALGTLIGTVMNPASNGGGHVQTAAKGGTGQTSFTKGDLLVAVNSSTISKLAVGTDTQILSANSSTASGVQWIAAPNNKITANASILNTENAEVSVLSVTIPGSTLGTSNAVRTTLFVPTWTTRDGHSVLTTVFYGGGPVASIMLVPRGADNTLVGSFEHTMFANNSSVLQRHYLNANMVGKNSADNANFGVVRFNLDAPTNQSSIVTLQTQVTATSSFNSAAPLTLGMTIRDYSSNSNVQVAGVIVEKIT